VHREILRIPHLVKHNTKQLTIPLGARSEGEMLGYTIHAVNKHSINCN